MLNGSPPRMRGKPSLSQLFRLVLRITPAGAGKTLITIFFRRCQQDHPRRCGENSIPRFLIYKLSGSPPQVRGKLITAIRDYLRTRITPAGAGKTSRCVCKSGRKRDHPRRCGENYLSARDYETAEGSPPQVRGKPVMVISHRAIIRITPAGAGKTR